MSPLLSSARLRKPSRQRGAIGLVGALTLAMALLATLLVIDSGRLYLEKRKLQRVADTAALEAVSRAGNCVSPGLTAAGFATSSSARNGLTVGTGTTLATACGILVTNAQNLRTFSPDATKTDAIQVIATRAVTSSLVSVTSGLFANGPLNTNLTAIAVAGPAPLPPQAALTIRSTLITADSTNSPLLNLILGQMLGSSLNLTAGGWQGLVDTNLNMLSYLNQLALDLHLAAGNYDNVLNTQVALTQVIDTAITVLTQGGTTTSLATSGLTQIRAAVGTAQVKLGDTLKIQSGSPGSALDTNLQVFQLVQAFVQLANSQNTATATVPLSIPGLVNGSVKLKVIQPPQLSAIGNPALAVLDPLGANRIYVRTAQIRLALSISLPVLDLPLQSALNGLVGPLSDTLNNLLSLNLAGTLSSVLCLIAGPCDRTDLRVLPNPSIGVVLESAAASSYVTAYACVSDATKTLTTLTNTSLVKVKVGVIDMTHVFDSTSDVAVSPMTIIDIGKITCSGVLVKVCDPATRVPFYGGGIALKVDTSVGSNTEPTASHTFPQPPEVKQPPQYYSLNTSDLVSSLKTALGGVQIQVYAPTGSSALGNVLVVSGTLLSGLTTALNNTVGVLLSPIVDPILNNLLNTLGITLNKVDVGANLSCKPPGRAGLVI